MSLAFSKCEYISCFRHVSHLHLCSLVSYIHQVLHTTIFRAPHQNRRRPLVHHIIDTKVHMDPIIVISALSPVKLDGSIAQTDSLILSEALELFTVPRRLNVITQKGRRIIEPLSSQSRQEVFTDPHIVISVRSVKLDRSIMQTRRLILTSPL